MGKMAPPWSTSCCGHEKGASVGGQLLSSSFCISQFSPLSNSAFQTEWVNLETDCSLWHSALRVEPVHTHACKRCPT